MIPSLRRHQESLETNPSSSKLWPDKKQFGYQHPGTRYWDTLDGICGDVDWDWTVDVVVYNKCTNPAPISGFRPCPCPTNGVAYFGLWFLARGD